MTEQFEAPATATIPKLRNPSLGTDPQEAHPSPAPTEEHEVIARAHLLVDKAHKERHQLQVMLAEATLAIESRNRALKTCELELAEARNNLAAMQSQIEAGRQEVSDCRAFFGSIRAQFDHFEIPLPIRRKVQKNGKPLPA